MTDIRPLRDKRAWVMTERGLEPSDERLQQIAFQIRAGRPVKAIAEQFDISMSRVSQLARRLGMPDRRRKARLAGIDFK